MYIVIAILVFGILIAVHELGHFVVAKLCGVKVNEFSIGMGPALVKKQGRETLYALRILPIGGYCAMEAEDEASEDPRAFTNQKAWKKILILCAGSFMNFLMGLILIVIMYADAESFVTPTIGSFMEGCPYESEEYFQVGDEFYSIDGNRIYLSSDISMFMERGGESHDIVVIRDGEKVELDDVTLEKRIYEEYKNSGPKYGFIFTSEQNSLMTELRYSWNTAKEFSRWVWLGLEDLVHGAVSLDDMSGPVGIVDMMNDVGEQSQTTDAAVKNMLYIAALIAINLAIMNMLPIPALDGGRVFLLLVTLVIEKLARKKLDPKYEGYIHLVGMVLLLGLMAVVMYNDIAKLITG